MSGDSGNATGVFPQIPQGQTRPLNLGEYFLTLGTPAIGFWFEVSLGQVRVDGVDEFSNSGETSLSDNIGCEVGKESLHHIHPGATCRGKVHVEPGMAVQPGCHFRMLMSAIIVGDDVDADFLGCFPVNLLEEAKPFNMGMSLFGAGDELAFQVIQGGKEGDGSMPGIIVGLSANMPYSQR